MNLQSALKAGEFTMTRARHLCILVNFSLKQDHIFFSNLYIVYFYDLLNETNSFYYKYFKSLEMVSRIVSEEKLNLTHQLLNFANE